MSHLQARCWLASLPPLVQALADAGFLQHEVFHDGLGADMLQLTEDLSSVFNTSGSMDQEVQRQQMSREFTTRAGFLTRDTKAKRAARG